MTDAPIRLELGGYTVDVTRRKDCGITLTVYSLFGSTVVPVPIDEWRRLVEYAPLPAKEGQ